ncbi:MAG: YybH family protein [Gemmatimonadales bacterium]
MRHALPALAVLACALTACKPQPISPADEQAIKDFDAAYATALNAGNMDAVMATYASDASVLAPGMPIANGTDAIRRSMTGMMSAMKLNLRLTPSKVTGQGDLAYVVGSYHSTVTMKDSTQATPPPEDGKYVEVLARQADKSWKLVADIWNPNSEPAAPAPPPARPRRH